METNRKKDIRERFRGIFFITGMVIALGLVYMSFQYKKYVDDLIVKEKLASISKFDTEEDVIITVRKQKERKPTEKFKPEPDDATDLPDETIEIIDPNDFQDGDDDLYTFDPDDFGLIDEPMTFANVEHRPIFPGCENIIDEEKRFACFQKQLIQFVQKEYRYTDFMRNMGLNGRMYINFIVEKDGSVSNVEIVRGADPLLEKEALRVVGSLPKLTPAKSGGRPVRMIYTVPVRVGAK